jgi:hypothetical protein
VTDWRGVDWKNPADKISRHFTVREALWLKRWGRMASERDGLTDHVKERICIFAEKMDRVRDFLGYPILVHRWWGPALYNAEVGGKPASKHLSLGDWSACDFHAPMPGAFDVEDCCTIASRLLLPKLEEFGLRMENNGAHATWLHLDDAPVLYARHFTP